MTSDNWGGARNGAGRPRRKWDSGGPGSMWIMQRGPVNGAPGEPEWWRVLSVGENEIEFQNVETEEIIIIHKGDE